MESGFIVHEDSCNARSCVKALTRSQDWTIFWEQLGPTEAESEESSGLVKGTETTVVLNPPEESRNRYKLLLIKIVELKQEQIPGPSF